MKNFAVQSRLVRTDPTTETTTDPVTGRSTMDPVMLHTIAKAQVQHTAVAVVSTFAALKLIDVAATAAKHIITTKIK